MQDRGGPRDYYGRLLQYGEAVVRQGQAIFPQRHRGEFEGALVTRRDGLRVLGRRGPRNDLGPRYGMVIRIVHHTPYVAKNRCGRRSRAESNSENQLERKHSPGLKKTDRRFHPYHRRPSSEATIYTLLLECLSEFILGEFGITPGCAEKDAVTVVIEPK